MNYQPQFPNQILSSDSIDYSTTNIHLSSSFNAGDYIGLRQNVWNNTLSGTNITVVIMDTGIYANHNVFTNDGTLNWSKRIIKFFDIIENKSLSPYDDHGHGTWAASIIGGNSSEYKGVATNVSFIMLKIFDNSGETNDSIFIRATNWILTNKDIFNIKIVSMSFGAKPELNNLDGMSRLQQATANLIDNGILVVAAAGNNGDPTIPYGDKSINAPASEKKVLAVGGVDYFGNMYPKSAKGPSFEGTIKPDVCAPAVGILGADKNYPDDYSYRTGTSGAVPFVAGLAALMLEKSPQLNPLQIKSLISLSSYRTIDRTTIKDNVQGWGIIQGYAALEALNPPIMFNFTSNIILDLNQNKTVFCLPLTLYPSHLFFELERLTNTTAEMYLFSKEPDMYGEPILLAHSINSLTENDMKKRMGIYVDEFNDFYLLVKLTQESSGTFIIRLIYEYKNLIFVAFLGFSIISVIYIANLSIKLRKTINMEN